MSILFKDLKAGHTVHVFNRKTAAYQTGIVAADPSLPHYQPTTPSMVVDVPITIDNETKTYTIPDSLSITYYNDTCLSTDTADILREVEQLDHQADTIISSVPTWEDIRRACANLRDTLNPEIKEKKILDDRMTKLEKNMASMTDMFKTFMEKFD